MWRDLRLGSRSRWWLWLAGGFALAGFGSAALNDVPLFVTMLGAFLAFKLVLLVLVALTIRWTSRDASRIVAWTSWGGPALLLVGFLLLRFRVEDLKLFADPAALQEGYFERGALRPMQGTFPNPGVFGWLMAVIGCYGVAATLGGRPARGGAALGCALLGILGSLRRKPIVGLPLAALSALWGVAGRRQRWAVVTLLGLLSLGAGLVTKDRLKVIVEDTRSGYLDPYAPTVARTLLYAVGWQVARLHFPLGAGFGRYGGYVSAIRYSPLYDQYGLSAVWGLSPEFPAYVEDTYWPHILGETGLLGAAFMALMLAALWGQIRSAARGAISDERILALGAGMVLVEALVESLSAPVFETSLGAFLVAVPIGITLSLAETRGSPRGESLRREEEALLSGRDPTLPDRR